MGEATMEAHPEDPQLGVKLALLVVGLVGFGLVMVYSASYALGYERFGQAEFYLKRQALAALLGLVAMFALSRLDARRLMALDDLLLLGALGLVVLTFIPGLAVGPRWVRLGPFNFQPTEFLKLALIVYLAASLTRRGERLTRFGEGVAPHLIVLGAAFLMAAAQPDFGMALMFAFITYSMLYLAGVRPLYLLGTLILGLPLLLGLLLSAPYRRARLLSFLSPFDYSTESGYQVIQSLVALGSGGVWGRGLGAGVEKLDYLPSAHTDFIFSVAGEELGLWGALLLLGGFLLLGRWGIRIALGASDRFSALLAGGITFALCGQAALNLGVAVGLLPVTGLTLPFVSYGRSSLLVSLAMVGLLLSVANQPNRARNEGYDYDYDHDHNYDGTRQRLGRRRGKRWTPLPRVGLAGRAAGAPLGRTSGVYGPAPRAGAARLGAAAAGRRGRGVLPRRRARL